MPFIAQLRWILVPLGVGAGQLNHTASATALPEAAFEPSAWCIHQAEGSPDAAHAIRQLLRIAGTDDCDQAEAILTQATTLALERMEIRDLRPLDSLSQLTWLSLSVIRWRMHLPCNR